MPFSFYTGEWWVYFIVWYKFYLSKSGLYKSLVMDKNVWKGSQSLTINFTTKSHTFITLFCVHYLGWFLNDVIVIWDNQLTIVCSITFEMFKFGSFEMSVTWEWNMLHGPSWCQNAPYFICNEIITMSQIWSLCQNSSFTCIGSLLYYYTQINKLSMLATSSFMLCFP